MARQRQPFKREAERRFPHRVDVPMPDGGLGQRLNNMRDWCREHAGEWGYHDHGEPGDPGEPRRDYARFYFMTEDDAAAFRRAWLDAA